MALNIYRRHGSNCPGGRPLHTMSYEADENRRGWKNCSCPIYASGTLQRVFKRKNTERRTWDEAKAVVSIWETAESWEANAPAPAPQEAARVAPEATAIDAAQGVTIVDGTDSFIANRRFIDPREQDTVHGRRIESHLCRL
jgi:hypothetical protein